jgi:acyl carrier protein
MTAGGEGFGPPKLQRSSNRNHFSIGAENSGMTAADIKEAILDILEGIAPDEDLSNLKDDVPFREQLELDSMDFLDIVMELRKRYRVQIPEDDYVELRSMQSTVAYLEPLMKDLQKA